ncbi:MAG: hypothetical protein GX259_10315 [Bacteroidales bacterium]|nr:hypothetical protein [Bacteroidales bacterium]
MRSLACILFIFSSLLLNATEQTPDLLIYKSDTIYIDYFPLEILSKKDSIIANRLKDTTCLSTDCWRQYIGIWKIENDSLFLIGLKDCCNYETIPLEKVFAKAEMQNGKIFANWYSEKIKAGFGKKIGFSEVNWEYTYEKTIEIKIVFGKIKKIEVQVKEPKTISDEKEMEKIKYYQISQ